MPNRPFTNPYLNLVLRYIGLLAVLYGYSLIIQHLGGFDTGHIYFQWLEIVFVLYFYSLFYFLLRPFAWRGLLAAVPILLVYLVHDEFFLVYGKVFRIINVSELPELLQILPLHETLLLLLALLLPLGLILWHTNYRRPRLIALWVMPLLLLVVSVESMPAAFASGFREVAHRIVAIPQWQVLAAISIVLAVITFALLLIDSKTLRGHGRSFLAVVSYFAATAVVWIVYDYSKQYLTPGSIIIGLLLLVGMVGILAVLLADAHEWAEALWSKKRRREFVQIKLQDDELPKVSIHVPAYNEPPEMLRQTLQALAELDYPDYEVIVIDNNTRDPAIWQPVEALCQELGERFHFYHVDPLSGFKAGALNFALQHTDPAATIVAVIDSDYIVDPAWLRDLTPQFNNDQIAIVQAPQDYRDFHESAFKSMCFSEYRGFFFIGMVTRNERNAIIQHGTMTMIRKSVLEEVGGWGEWCITEDAELGLRIFEEGHEAVYISRSYGRGLMPDTFSDYKKQRYRWAYGAMQILKHHWRSLMRRNNSHLSYGQRYHFMAGWLPWIGDGINLIFTVAAICWSIAMMVEPKFADPPLIIFAILPVSLFCFKIAKIIYLYRTTVQASLKHTISAAWSGLALSHTIAVAVLAGLLTRDKPFFRTPKLKRPNRLLIALIDVRWEWLFALGLWCSAIGVYVRQPPGGMDLHLWLAMLMIQSLPYLAAIVMALISGLPSLPVHNDKDAVTPEPDATPLKSSQG
ncbi:MAG: glycosyltransferase [Gammaproteobacteria bacterium]